MSRSALVTFVFFLFLAPGVSLAEAASDVEPAYWSEIGTVTEWMKADSHFYRIEQLTGSLSPRFYGDDQQEVYRKTLGYDTSLPPLTLTGFRNLPPDQVRERRRLARKVLKRVSGFRDRMADLVMRVRGQQDVGWGIRDQDPRVMDDLLGRLQTAVGLDPANPYAWHLLAYLATSCGDLQRGLADLDGLDAALDQLPASDYVDMRLRARLDRAWLLRDLGRFTAASSALDAVGPESAGNLEVRVLRGLIAAQTGDMKQALQAARELDGQDIPVFQHDWEANSIFAPAVLDPMAWGTKPSSFLMGWIQALAWLHEGNTGMAKSAFPEFSRMRHYYPFGTRFWNDAGAIYEATGRLQLAVKAWRLALMYTPYYPYLVTKSYALDLSNLTGRQGNQPFTVAYDTNFLAGNRLAYGMDLVIRAVDAEDRAMQVYLAGQAVRELKICVRAGLDPVGSNLALGYAHAVLGDPLAILEDTRAAQSALERGDAFPAVRKAVTQLEQVARRGMDGSLAIGRPAWDLMNLPWQPGEEPAAVEARLRGLLAEDPDSEEARRDLARFLLRHGKTEEAAALVDVPAQEDLTRISAADLILALEFDRQRNSPARAEKLLGMLDTGGRERWPDPRLWTLVGFICQDAGISGGRRALEYALELDPGNEGLRRQLSLPR